MGKLESRSGHRELNDNDDLNDTLYFCINFQNEEFYRCTTLNFFIVKNTPTCRIQMTMNEFTDRDEILVKD